MSIRNRRPESAKKGEGASKNESGTKKKSTFFTGKSFNPSKRPETLGDSNILSHQTWARVVMMASVLIVTWTASGRQQTRKTIMAKQTDIITDNRHQNLLCSPSFKKEITDLGNKECLPAKCGRVVMDNVVTEKEAHGLLEIAKKGLSKGGSAGGASILDLHSGALSQDENFVNLYKLHPDLFNQQDMQLYRSVKDKVRKAIASHFQVKKNKLYLTHPTFFSRITSDPAKTLHDEYWHIHVDKETYPNFHFTSLLYLTDFDIDFKGGEFVFVDSNDKVNRTIQPRLGRVSAFTSGIENKHHVEPVTEGMRYALTMGFTCDKTKEIEDPFSKVP